MTWAGAIAALKTNCATAGADVTPAITNVRIGEPDTLTQDTIALWLTARRDSQTGGQTLGKVNIERGVMVRTYLRGSVRATAKDEDLEQRLIDVDAALLTRIWADVKLGGNVIGIAVDDADYGWEVLGDQLARTISFTVWLDLAEVATISD